MSENTENTNNQSSLVDWETFWSNLIGENPKEDASGTESKDEIVDEIISMREKIKALKRDILDKKIAAKERHIEALKTAIEQTEQNGRPSIGLVSWATSQHENN